MKNCRITIIVIVTVVVLLFEPGGEQSQSSTKVIATNTDIMNNVLYTIERRGTDRVKKTFKIC